MLLMPFQSSMVLESLLSVNQGATEEENLAWPIKQMENDPTLE